MTDASKTAAGWYPTAEGERYWDGSAWTDQFRPPQAQAGASVPQGVYYQPVPQKKSHTLRNVLLILGLLFILFVGGCFALVGTAANEAGKAIDKSLAEEAANDKPTPVDEGEAFDHDGYHIDAGWKLGKDDLTDRVTITGLRVTNVKNDDFTGSEAGRTALLTFRLYKGSENLAEITCDGKELQEGESSTMDCSSTDKLPKDYDTIKVADLF